MSLSANNTSSAEVLATTSTTTSSTSSTRRRSSFLNAQGYEVDLYTAALEGEFKVVKDTMEEGQVILVAVDDTDDDDFTLLQCAVQGGSVDLVKYLIEKGADDEDFETQEGYDSLIKAVINGHLPMIKYLAKYHSVDMEEACEESGLCPLLHACSEGHIGIVRYLINKLGIDEDAKDNDEWTALHYACMGGHLDIVRFLIEQCDFDPEETETDDWTPFHIAANRGRVEIVKHLLEKHNVSRTARIDGVEQNALHLAASEGSLEVVKYLMVNQGFTLDAVSGENETALHLASIYGQTETVKYLVQEYSLVMGGGNATAAFESRSKMLFAKDDKGQTPSDAALACMQADDNEYQQQDVIDFLQSHVAPLAVDLKVNAELTEQQRETAERTLQILEATDIHPVAHKVMEYLSLSDVEGMAL